MSIISRRIKNKADASEAQQRETNNSERASKQSKPEQILHSRLSPLKKAVRDGLLQFFLGPRPSDTIHLQLRGRGDRDLHLSIPGSEYRTPIDTHKASER